MEYKDKKLVKEHLANEQTFLAWLRTGIEVMAFGFVAIKFSLFASQIMGIILVATGTVMIVFAYFRYRKTMKQLRDGNFSYSGRLIAITAAVVILISSVLIYYLIFTSQVHTSQEHNATKGFYETQRI